MAHTERCENAIDPECHCTGCGGQAHGLTAGVLALAVLVSEASAGTTPSKRSLRLARKQLRWRARELGQVRRKSAWWWLRRNVDVFELLAEDAIDCAKGSTPRGLAGDVVDPIGASSRSHALCELLARVALALDDAVADIKQGGRVLVDEAVRDRFPDAPPLVRDAICQTAYALKNKAVDYGIGLAGWDVALTMARVGAVIVCPAIDEHPAVKACGTPLIEEPLADEVRSELRANASLAMAV